MNEQNKERMKKYMIEHEVRISNLGKYCLDDIFVKILKRKKFEGAMKKIEPKVVIGGRYYISYDQCVELLKTKKRAVGKGTLKSLFVLKNEIIEVGNQNDEITVINNNEIPDWIVKKIEPMQLTFIKTIFNTFVMHIEDGHTQIWFDFVFVTTYLQYNNLHKPMDLVDTGLIISLEQIEKMCDRHSIVNPIDKQNKRITAKFVNLAGFLDLISSSRMKLAKELKKWTHAEIIPTLFRVGSYSIKLLDFSNFYISNHIVNYVNKKVIYIGYIGIYNGEHLFKFGISDDLFRRDFNEHKKSFSHFQIVHVEIAENHELIESIFKKQLRSDGMMRSKKINEKQQTELFAISYEITHNDRIRQIKEIIKETPTAAQIKEKHNTELKNAVDAVVKGNQNDSEVAQLRQQLYEFVASTEKRFRAVEMSRCEVVDATQTKPTRSENSPKQVPIINDDDVEELLKRIPIINEDDVEELLGMSQSPQKIKHKKLKPKKDVIDV
jgi:prophage antirepressor-like protein